jgi:hypothetical protein
MEASAEMLKNKKVNQINQTNPFFLILNPSFQKVFFCVSFRLNFKTAILKARQ